MADQGDVGGVKEATGERRRDSRLHAQQWRDRIREWEAVEWGIGFSGLGGGNLGTSHTPLLALAENNLRFLLGSPSPPEDIVSRLIIASGFVESDEEDDVTHYFKRSPPSWSLSTALTLRDRDWRTPIERLVAFEIGGRRPFARLHLSDQRERWQDDSLRWAFAAHFWQRQFERGLALTPGCLACGLPTANCCGGTRGEKECGRALCNECEFEQGSLGPCCIRWR